MTVEILTGDAEATLRTLPDASCHMCVTSPPFFGLRDYGVDGQIGLEATPDEWVERLVGVFREVGRVLRPDGTLWLEVGDSYAGSGPSGAAYQSETTKRRADGDGTDGVFRVSKTLADRGLTYAQKKPVPPPGLKPKDLIGAPWLLARALRDPYYAGRIKSETDRAWLAAMLDGEGCIAIHRRPAGQKAYTTYERKDGTKADYRRTADTFQPKVEITNTSLAIIERIVALTGEGNANTKQEAGTYGRKQTIYRWTLTADKARSFLREVYPFLVAKRQEARIGFGCPSSGDEATAAWEALKILHAGSETTVDFPEPPTLYEGGWFLRSDIIWAREPRPNPMPESVRDRPTKAHSYVFLLSRQPRYFYDQEAIREPASENTHTRYAVPRESPKGAAKTAAGEGHEGWDSATNGYVSHRNARSVWSIPTQPLSEPHYAAFPEELARRCILAGTSERGVCPECGAPWRRIVERGELVGVDRGGNRKGQDVGALVKNNPGTPGLAYEMTTVGWEPGCLCGHEYGPGGEFGGGGPMPPAPATVLDPFLGSGTTALVARKLGRACVGIELSPEYVEIAWRRLRDPAALNRQALDSPEPAQLHLTPDLEGTP